MQPAYFADEARAKLLKDRIIFNSARQKRFAYSAS